MSENDTERDTQGRTVMVHARGADLPSLEMDALDGAREFFGPDARLAVVPDYRAVRLSAPTSDGERFAASVTVREITP